MNEAEKKKEEALKPFKEKIELVDGFIEEIREKLGEDNATLVNDSLLGVRATVTEAAALHEETVESNITTQERNKKLADVNNDLYIKSSKQLTGKEDNHVVEIDEENALQTFAESLFPDK